MAKSEPAARRSFIERPSTAILFLLSVFVGGLVIGAVIAKIRPPRATTGPTTVYVVGATGPSGLAPGERVKVVMVDTSTGNSGTAREAVVDDRGNIELPLVGRLNVLGMSAEQAGRVIAQGYKDQNIAGTMEVRVTRIPRMPTTAPK